MKVSLGLSINSKLKLGELTLSFRSHPKDGEGNVFTGVCLSTEGVPQFQVLSQVTGLRSFPGVPQDGVSPCLVTFVTSEQSSRASTATQRAVCLLRSRRRTLLFHQFNTTRNTTTRGVLKCNCVQCPWP